MNQLLLLTRPNYDPATNYLFHWSVPVIELAKQKGLKTIDLAGKKANRFDFTGRVEKLAPSFIFLNGHGGQAMVMGQDDEILVSAGDNEVLLKGKIVFARSCSSAKELGPRSVSVGARTFIGYEEPFVFVTDLQTSTRPRSDETAKLFLEPSNQVVTTLIKGHTCGEAHERAKQGFGRNIRKLLTSKTTEEDVSSLRFLLWDMNHQVCLGDPEATIFA